MPRRPAAAATPAPPPGTAPTPNGPARSAARPSPRRLTAQQLAAWQPLFDNARKLRALLAELQELTLEVLQDSQNPGP
jgi:hypothetical protein